MQPLMWNFSPNDTLLYDFFFLLLLQPGSEVMGKLGRLFTENISLNCQYHYLKSCIQAVVL